MLFVLANRGDGAEPSPTRLRFLIRRTSLVSHFGSTGPCLGNSVTRANGPEHVDVPPFASMAPDLGRARLAHAW
jgi:hypothetical protein